MSKITEYWGKSGKELRAYADIIANDAIWTNDKIEKYALAHPRTIPIMCGTVSAVAIAVSMHALSKGEWEWATLLGTLSLINGYNATKPLSDDKAKV